MEYISEGGEKKLRKIKEKERDCKRAGDILHLHYGCYFKALADAVTIHPSVKEHIKIIFEKKKKIIILEFGAIGVIRSPWQADRPLTSAADSIKMSDKLSSYHIREERRGCFVLQILYACA